MTPETFFHTYSNDLKTLLNRYAEIEAIRLGEVLKSGSHYQINYEKQAINDLSKAKMLVNAIDLVK